MSPHTRRALKSVPENPVAAVLALGANLGDTAKALDAAIEGLQYHPAVTVRAVSPRAITRPEGGPLGQPDYLNQIVLLDTVLAPLDLLYFGHQLEAEAHRVRTERWGPRTLDVDIISYGQLRSDDEELTLPHPRAAQRAFVLLPWYWVDPHARLDGVPVAELLQDPEVAAEAHLVQRL